MKQYLIFIIALVFSLDVSAQVRASLSASVTIVDVAGTSFFANSDAGIDSISGKDFVKYTRNIVRADQTAELGRLTLTGASTYSITLPTEPIILSRLSGNELLTIKTLQAITSKEDNNSIKIIASCQLDKTQAPGLYSAVAPINIVIEYN